VVWGSFEVFSLDCINGAPNFSVGGKSPFQISRLHVSVHCAEHGGLPINKGDPLFYSLSHLSDTKGSSCILEGLNFGNNIFLPLFGKF
jgi:hypothetical protein